MIWLVGTATAGEIPAETSTDEPCRPAPLAVAWTAGNASRQDCLFFDIQAAGRAYASFPDTGVSRGVALTRARAEVAARVSDMSARIVLGAVRSAGEQGYLGVDGEAYVPEFRVAEARVDLPDLGLALAAGIVDDPYVMTVQTAWGRRDLLGTLGTDQGYLDRSDVGGWLGWSPSGGAVSATVALSSGEGFNRRERNDGVNTTGVLHLRPLGDSLWSPELVLMAREGSRGLASALDHRVGGAALLRHEYGTAGAELLMGWGLQGDGARRPFGSSVWVSTETLPVLGVLRADLARDNRVSRTADELLLMGAIGLPLPGVFGEQPEASTAPAVLLAGLEARQYGADARPIASAEAYASSKTVFLVLSTTLRGSLSFEPR